MSSKQALNLVPGKVWCSADGIVEVFCVQAISSLLVHLNEHLVQGRKRGRRVGGREGGKEGGRESERVGGKE